MRTVARLPVDPGPAGWNCLLPEQTLYPMLSEAITADWLVIGAGFAGLTAARRLVQLDPTASIVLLDAHRIAEGPAGRNSGFMIDLPHDLASDDYGGDLTRDRDQITLNRHAIAFAQAAAHEYGLSNEAFSVSGKINAAASDQGLTHNSTYADHLAALNEPHEALDRDAMQRITGSTWFKGGLYTPGTAMIQPARYVRDLASGLSSSLNFYERSPVVALTRQGASWQASTPHGKVDTGNVILAVNGHVQSFGFFQRQLIHVFTYASMTRVLTEQEVKRLGGEPVWGATPADPVGTTVRRISGVGGHRLIIRNRFTCHANLEVPQESLASVARTHDRSFINRFPMLKDVSMEYRWGGRLCLSKNNVSAFGELDSGLYSACCQNGLGVARGTLGGKLIAELATNNPSTELDLLMREEPPQRLPPDLLTQWGANAKIRWNEWRAKREL